MATSTPRPLGDHRVPTAAEPHVNVPMPSGAVVLVDPRVHRADIVRRLLRAGVAARTLLALLPSWDALIRSIAAEEATARCDGTPGGVSRSLQQRPSLPASPS